MPDRLVIQDSYGLSTVNFSKFYKIYFIFLLNLHTYYYIEDFKEAFSVDYAHIENTKAEETTIADIITTNHPVGSNIIFIINLNAN